MNHRSLAILFLTGIAVAGNRMAFAEEAMKGRIHRLARPYLKAELVVGMTVGVVHKGETTVVGYGRVSEKDKRLPDGNTVYEIGSVTKVFTGLLLADAVVRNRVQLDEPVQGLLPDGVTMPIRGHWPITLRDLSTHASGLPPLPDNMKFGDPMNPYADYTLENLYSFLNSNKLARAPGQKYEYSNLGGGMLGDLLALEAGKTYEQLVIDQIAGPLKMADTTVGLSEPQQARLAAPHSAGGAPAKNWDVPTLAGAGALRSTTNDMLRFIEANLDPPAGELGKAIELAWQVQRRPSADDDVALGLGWHIAGDGQTRWHNGETGGYHSMMMVNRELESGVIVLANTAASEVDQLGGDLIRMLAGARVEPRQFENVVKIPRKTMERYVGRYQLTPDFIFTVSVEDDRLMVGITNQPTQQVFPRSATEWHYKSVEATLTFKVDIHGKCKALELFQNGNRQTARRID